METLRLLASFGLICLAAAVVGQAFQRLRLPTITGYLFTGAIAGSFVLDLFPSADTEQLRFVDEISLAVIAFVAGSELLLSELKARLRPILSIAGSIIAVAFVLLVAGIFVVTNFLSFTENLSRSARLATALLGAAVLLALSPPSTIAVIKELRARGPYTRTSLSVTVVMDVAIIVLFAMMTSLAAPLLTNEVLDLSFLLLLAADLGSAVVIGLATGLILKAALAQSWHPWIKIGAVLALGFGVYELADWVRTWSTDSLGVEVYIEPLLISLIGGFYVANFTPFRREFDDLLHQVGPAVYVAFFTITGLSLKLDLLGTVLPVALVLFLLRAVGIGAGSYLGGRLAHEPARFTRISWAAFITQAGIALGLAREVAVQFPTLGDAFATLVVSVVVINEIVGPLFLKWGIRRAGESNEPGVAPGAGARGVVILGVEGQSMALSRALTEQGWQVVVADTDAGQVERLAADDVDERHIEDVGPESLNSLIDDHTRAVVAMLGDDEANLAALRFALERHGIDRLVARPATNDRLADFEELGAFLVDPASAMVGLLGQAVDAPQSAALLMHRDPDRTIAQITVTNRDLQGVAVRDLSLPTDVLLLEMLRRKDSVVVNGHTSLRIGDQLTVVGSPDSLETVRHKLSA